MNSPFHTLPTVIINLTTFFVAFLSLDKCGAAGQCRKWWVNPFNEWWFARNSTRETTFHFCLTKSKGWVIIWNFLDTFEKIVWGTVMLLDFSIFNSIFMLIWFCFVCISKCYSENVAQRSVININFSFFRHQMNNITFERWYLTL